MLSTFLSYNSKICQARDYQANIKIVRYHSLFLSIFITHLCAYFKWALSYLAVCGTLATRHEIIVIIVIKFCKLKLFQWVDCYSSFDYNIRWMILLCTFCLDHIIIRVDCISMICIFLRIFDADFLKLKNLQINLKQYLCRLHVT